MNLEKLCAILFISPYELHLKGNIWCLIFNLNIIINQIEYLDVYFDDKYRCEKLSQTEITNTLPDYLITILVTFMSYARFPQHH